jgi:hypothetical protein
MSEEPVTPQETTVAPEKPARKPLSGQVKLAIGVGAVLILVLILSWASGVKQKTAVRETYAKGVNALSVAVTPTFLEQRPEKLQRLAQSIAEAGGFESVLFADADGKVLASTDTKLQGQTLRDLKDEVDKVQGTKFFDTEVVQEHNRIRATRGIYVAGAKAEGNTRLGWIRVTAFK